MQKKKRSSWEQRNRCGAFELPKKHIIFLQSEKIKVGIEDSDRIHYSKEKAITCLWCRITGKTPKRINTFLNPNHPHPKINRQSLHKTPRTKHPRTIILPKNPRISAPQLWSHPRQPTVTVAIATSIKSIVLHCLFSDEWTRRGIIQAWQELEKIFLW